MTEAKCATCAVVRVDDTKWAHMTRINPITRERVIVWRCPACDLHAAVGLGMSTTPERLKRARERGGVRSARAQIGTTRRGVQ
jgi:hypothetical protein